MKKKASALEHVNRTALQGLNPALVEVEICRSEKLDQRRGLTSELDEMWSYVRSKAHPRWLWHAIDHHTGQV
jgi:insertion element IS1 protein InsB